MNVCYLCVALTSVKSGEPGSLKFVRECLHTFVVNGREWMQSNLTAHLNHFTNAKIFGIQNLTELRAAYLIFLNAYNVESSES
jgi:hypothetical protein